MVELKGQKGFDQFYKKQYDADRYKTLIKSFKLPTRYCLIINPLFPESELLTHIKSWLSELKDLPNYGTADGYSKYTQLDKYSLEGYLSPYVKSTKNNQEVPFPSPLIDGQTNLQTHYLLDAASLLPILNLDLKANDKVLDMCAAPGGKSLMCSFILHQLRPQLSTSDNLSLDRGQVVSNEYDKARYVRLTKVMKSYLSSEHTKTIRQRINGNFESTKLPPLNTTINLDGSDVISLKNVVNQEYDKVLVDVPCSSERHVINDSEFLSKFKVQSGFNDTQFSLLVSAFKLVKVNGIIIYSTCSINKFENDLVIEKLFERFPNMFEVVSEDLVVGEGTDAELKELGDNDKNSRCWCEPTKLGRIVLPDKAYGWGPIFFTKLRKLK